MFSSAVQGHGVFPPLLHLQRLSLSICQFPCCMDPLPFIPPPRLAFWLSLSVLLLSPLRLFIRPFLPVPGHLWLLEACLFLATPFLYLCRPFRPSLPPYFTSSRTSPSFCLPLVIPLFVSLRASLPLSFCQPPLSVVQDNLACSPAVPSCPNDALIQVTPTHCLCRAHTHTHTLTEALVCSQRLPLCSHIMPARHMTDKQKPDDIVECNLGSLNTRRH